MSDRVKQLEEIHKNALELFKKKIPKKILIDKEKEMKILSTMELQEIWRQKQINIFYKTGRPIYGKYIGSRLVCDIH